MEIYTWNKINSFLIKIPMLQALNFLYLLQNIYTQILEIRFAFFFNQFIIYFI